VSGPEGTPVEVPVGQPGPPITVATDGAVATVTISNPPVNALDEAVLEALDACLAGLVASDCRTVVLAATGKVFVAGGDISELKAMLGDADAARSHVELTGRVFGRLASMPQPVVAAVHGTAAGGGFELVLACDLVVAAEGAGFLMPEVGIGLIPGAGGTQRLARRIGQARATELILLRKWLSAAEAAALGVVNRVVVDGAVAAEAAALAAELAGLSRSSVTAALRAIREGLAEPLAAGLQIEQREFLSALASADAREGLAAFLEKRPPDFSGSRLQNTPTPTQERNSA
jgi:enoyl-CoA hydratase/carnithine racemase